MSRATVQRVLRAAGLTSPRRRRPPGTGARRPRKLQAGLLLQFDGSPFAWFGPTQPPCSLLAAIDDATGAVLAGTFRAQEDAAGYLRLLHTLGRTVGLLAAVYTDAHGIFVRHDPHWTLAEELPGAPGPDAGRAGPPDARDPPHRRPEPPGQGPDRAALEHAPGPRSSPSSRLAGITHAWRRATPSSPPRSSRPSPPGSPVPAAVATSAVPLGPRGCDLDAGLRLPLRAPGGRSTTPCGWTGRRSPARPGPHRRSYAQGRRPTSSSASTARGASTSVSA
ncbi:MAG: hypothetical protein MZW92_38530 [Comamonadaceae bacterium]|nr:hypothetical protein [Comamonadaceae bacterium]